MNLRVLPPPEDGERALRADLVKFPLSDVGNAERFATMYGSVVRHVAANKQWRVWTGSKWAADRDGAVVRFMTNVARETQRAANEIENKDRRQTVWGWAFGLESRPRLDAALKLAQSVEGLHATPGDFDADPLLLNVQNGTIDLRTGKLRDHDPLDLCAKVAPVAFDPTATCPRFEKFIAQVCLDRTELIRFIRRAVGYSLTGLTDEQVAFFLHGGGSNGKTTILEVLGFLFGDYGQVTPFSTLTVKTNDHSAREDLADLVGARLVTATESAKGQRFNDAVFKHITGGDKIKARRLYGHLFSFNPTHKIWLAANHRPHVDDNSEGMWRRLRMIPFDARFGDGDKDPNLRDKLLGELPGILNWAIGGCLEWREHGLGESIEVRDATARYRERDDRLGAFLEECCELNDSFTVSIKALKDRYTEWCESMQEEPLSSRKFNEALEDLGPRRDRDAGRRFWRGLTLKSSLFVSEDPGATTEASPIAEPVSVPTFDPQPSTAIEVQVVSRSTRSSCSRCEAPLRPAADVCSACSLPTDPSCLF